MTLCGWQNIIKMQLSNLFGCSGVRMLSIIQTNAKAVFRHAKTVPVSVSLSCLLFLSGLLFILSFLPTRATITGHSIHWPFLIQLHANTFTHTLHSLSLAAPPFLFLSYRNSTLPPPPPPPPNKSLPLPSLTPTWNDCKTTKTLGKHQIPPFTWQGAAKTAKILLAESYEQDWEDGRVPDTRKLQL